MDYFQLQRRVGLAVKKTREEKGLSREALAELSELSVQEVTLVEEDRLSLYHLYRVAEGLKVRLSDLFSLAENDS